MPPVRRSRRAHQTRYSLVIPPKPPTHKPKPSYLQRSITDPNQDLTLFSLPRELFDEIIGHLPRAAEICLTLTCKQALHTIGKSSWGRFRAKRGLYNETHGPLCELLQRDLPGFEYCPCCEMLHPPIKPPHAHRTTKFTKLCLGQSGTIDIWPQTAEGGYSLVYTHIEEAFEFKCTGLRMSEGIDLFTGDFTVPLGAASYRLSSSARWVEQNLVLRQEHRLRRATESPLQAVDITSLPFRVCAHLTTTTSPPPEAQRANISRNGPLLTHAISSAFPGTLRRGVADLSTFRKPAPTEETQMASGQVNEDFVWQCRSCPTKFCVQYINRNGGELVVTVWHCFGKELYKAQDYWRMFVRREGPTLGAKKRNSEFHVSTRSLPDFRID
ncbi:hypothetical protein BDV12DRAFT_205920 [Aspergillus spectabilis]